MFTAILVLTREPTPPTPLLSHVSKKCSSPVSYMALIGPSRLSQPDDVVLSPPSLHQQNLPPVLINTQVRLVTRYLSECKIPIHRKTSKTVLLYKKGDPQEIGKYRPICFLSVIYKLFTRAHRMERTLDEKQASVKAGFQKFQYD
ncbi:hypothetical protein RB195_001158 [Necator americanus]|uniref:Reverse transcriptase domain-containing protein n=1 Tax=Necator americanus TaxID=51031 RepID=A0ABR1DEK0_NECAM